MSALTTRIIVPALNHVLMSEPWALSRLLPYAEKSLRIVAPPIDLLLCISECGTLAVADSEISHPDVTITLPDDAVLMALSGDRASAFGAARLSGSADFAEVIAFVFRNLRWDAEADLAALVGDIPAHRGNAAIQKFIAWQRRSAINLGYNFKEFLTEESRQVVDQHEIVDFGLSVNTIRDDLARLEKRISRL